MSRIRMTKTGVALSVIEGGAGEVAERRGFARLPDWIPVMGGRAERARGFQSLDALMAI